MLDVILLNVTYQKGARTLGHQKTYSDSNQESNSVAEVSKVALQWQRQTSFIH